MRFPAGRDDLCDPMLHNRHPPAGSGYLARSSTVTAARWCVRDFGAHGQVVQLRQATGSLTALDRALHAPRPAPLPTNVACAGVGYAIFTVEVLDQHGRRIRPTLPSGQCAGPSGTRDALARTAYTVIDTHPALPE